MFAITAVAVALYTTLGFIIAMSLMLFVLIALEGRNLIAAAAFSLGISLVDLCPVHGARSNRRWSRACSDSDQWEPRSTACCSAFRSRCSRMCCGTAFSAASSAHWSAYCPASVRLSGISILLPVTFGLDATKAIVMLAGIYYGSQYGGSTTSILMRIPGEASSVMTCIDGYAMAQEGPRRRRAVHRRGRLMDRRHLRRRRC